MASAILDRVFRPKNDQILLPLGLSSRARRKRDHGYLLYLMLHMTGFLAVTLLMTWGVILFFFLAIGSFSLDGMMHHLANLSTRYIGADAGRIAQFKAVVGTVHLVVAGAIIFFRRHSILPRDGKVRSADHV